MPSGDAQRKVVAGQRLQRGIPASVYNGLIDLLQTDHTSDSTTPAGRVRQATVIKVCNSTTADQERFAVLGIDAPLILPTDNELNFSDEVTFDCSLPQYAGLFVVLLEPIREGSIGRAVVAGVTPAWISGTGDFADVTADDTSVLTCQPFGSARVLWSESGSGERWAVVRLGDAGEGTGLGGNGRLLIALVYTVNLGAAYTRTANKITASANGVLGDQDYLTLVVGDRILFNPGTSADAGVWAVTDLGSGGTPFILDRVADNDTSAEMPPGLLVVVTNGDTWSDTLWELQTDGPITLNTTQLDFAQIGGSGSIQFATQFVCQGRLSLDSDLAVSTSDVVGGTTIYWQPYKGSSVVLPVGGPGSWAEVKAPVIGLEQIALSGLTTDKNYDVFLFYDSASAGIGVAVGPAWTSDTARGSGAGTTELAWTYVNGHGNYGVLTNEQVLTPILSSPSISFFNAGLGLYVGTFRATSATATEDSIAKRFLWNNYNRVARRLYIDSASSHTYNSTTIRAWNASNSNRIQMVVGYAEDAINVNIHASITAAVDGTATSGKVGIGKDSTTAYQWNYPITNGNIQIILAGITEIDDPILGFHYYQAVEAGHAASPPTFASVSVKAVMLG